MNQLIFNSILQETVNPEHLRCPPISQQIKDRLSFLYRHFVSFGVNSTRILAQYESQVNAMEKEVAKIEKIAFAKFDEKNALQKEIFTIVKYDKESSLYDVENYDDVNRKYYLLSDSLNNLSLPSYEAKPQFSKIAFIFSLLTFGFYPLYRILDLQDKVDLLERKKLAAIKMIKTVKDEFYSLGTYLDRIDNQLEAFAQYNPIRIEYNRKEEEVENLKREEKELTETVDRMTKVIMQKPATEKKLALLKEKERQIGELVPMQPKAGFLPPRYQRRPDDLEVSTVANEAYANAVKEKKSVAGIILACFGEACNQWQISGFPILAPHQDRRQKMSLYAFTVLHLIVHSELDLDPTGCHGPRLALNENIHIYPTKPKRVITKAIDPETQQEIITTKIIPTCVDPLTAPELLNENYHGIDPISLKWIVSRMTKEEVASLMKTIADYTGENLEPCNKQIGLALQLISDMATILEHKFDDLLLYKWEVSYKI